MNVIHSIRSWLPGTQTWLFNQIRYLPAVESHVVCNTTLNLDQFPMLHLYAAGEPVGERGWLRRLRSRKVLGYPVRWWRRRAHRRFVSSKTKASNASVLHSHFGTRAWHDSPAAKRTGVAHVVTFYGFDVNFYPQQHPVWRQRYEQLFEAVDAVLCEGPHMAGCIAKLGCPEAKIHVHHLGVEVDTIAFRPRSWRPDEPLRILMAAGFREKKGLPYGLRAAAKLGEELDVRVTLVGDASAGVERSEREKDKILQTITDCGLEDRVELTGFCTHQELFEHAHRHHVFLTPSVTASSGDTEGGAPIALIEMAATGTPVVSTTHCDIPEVIEHGKSGLLAAERDVEGLAEHLKWLAEHPEQWAPMAEAARAHIEQEFSARRQGERLAKIYRDVLDR